MSFTNGTQLQADPGAYTVDDVNDVAGLTQTQVDAYGNIASAGGTLTFSDPDQLDTHTWSIRNAQIDFADGELRRRLPRQWSSRPVGRG